MVETLILTLRRVLEGMAVVCLALLLGLVFMQVVFRYGLQISVPFTEEAARYVGVWLVFSGGAALVASDRHIRLTFVVDRTRGTVASLLMAVTALLVLAFNAIILVGGIRLIGLNWNQSATTLPVTVSVLYMALAFCAACSILFALYRLKGFLRQPER